MSEGHMGETVEIVRDRIGAAARRAGRDPTGVRIVAATKYADVPQIEEAAAAGIREFGENRATDLDRKAAAVGPEVVWHYLGAIQTNKIRFLERAVLLQGLYREREAQALQAHGERSGRDFDVLIEVNVAGEASKQGVAPGGVEALLDRLEPYPRVRPRGFMFVAPQVENPEDVRWVFAEGKRLSDRFEGRGMRELSMGMTDDYEVAIEEGATIVRIGRAIFRPEVTS
jgi:pyridoxal phosphate enzyme (YggS family)